MKHRITAMAKMAHPTDLTLEWVKKPVRGWKVNPYFFIHKKLTKNGNPVRYSEWHITHIPTGLALLKQIKIEGALTIKKLKEVTNKWFPAWSAKQIGKKTNISEEHKRRWAALKQELDMLRESQDSWEV